MSRRGFSLLEAVVALAIVGLAGVAALAAFGAELRTADRARRALEAEALAEARLAVARLLSRGELSPLADSVAKGRFPPPFETYSWELASRTLPREEDLFEVAVEVTWDQGAYALVTRVYRPHPVLRNP